MSANVRIQVNGEPFTVSAGTSVAAALWNSGITRFRESRRGEPRAPVCGMGICFECRVSVDGEPHQRSCLVTVRDGMGIETEDTGLPRHVSAESRESETISVDLLVAGAGPAGIAAACIAAENGLSVAVVDQGERPGGQIWRGREPAAAGSRWRERFTRSGALHLPRSAVVDIEPRDDHVRAVVESTASAQVMRSSAILLATGARELFLPFPGWTLPGVFGVGGAQALIKSGLQVAGKRVVVAGTGPLILAAAAALRHAGADVLCVLEQASFASTARFSTSLWRSPSTLAQAAQLGSAVGIRTYRTSSWVVAARGEGRLRAVTIQQGRGQRAVECDVLCVGMGLVPSTELARLAGCEVGPAFSGVRTDQAQRTTVPRVFAAGEAVGVGGAELAVVQGMIAGYTVAERPIPPRLLDRRNRLREIAQRMRDRFALREELRALVTNETLVCRCEDVAFGDVNTRGSARAAKLYTRCGMGPCQGRVCGGAMQFLAGWDSDTIREPVQPARAATLTLQIT